VRVLVLSAAASQPASRDKLRALAGLGCEVLAALPGGTAASDGAVRRVPIPVRGRLDQPSTLRWHGRTLRRVFSDFRPSLVHVEASPDALLGDLARRLAQRFGVPLVILSDETLPRRLGLLARRRAGRVLRAAAGVIGVSKRAEALLSARAPEALAAVIPQAGVPLPSPVAPPARDGLAIGFVGRLVPERGLDLLLTALAQTFGRWTLSVLGTGPEQERLEEMVERAGLASRVRWRGGIGRDALAVFWSEIDCAVMPSRDTETWVEPNSPLLLEAMGRGIAPIVTPAGALADLVGDCAPVIASAEELAQVLQTWVADPATCRATGARARERVMRHYVTAEVAKRTLDFWRAVAAGRTAATA
jgi:glycosyltransferase involved in cell wall biosynthesis